MNSRARDAMLTAKYLDQFAALADDLDYYASKTDGGTYAGGLADAAHKIHQVIDGTYLRGES